MNTAKRLNIVRIECTARRDRDIWLSDNDGSRGFGRLLVRIGRSGSRRFYYRYSRDKHQHTVSLGLYSRHHAEGYLTLAEARDLALHCALVAHGLALPAPDPFVAMRSLRADA